MTLPVLPLAVGAGVLFLLFGSKRDGEASPEGMDVQGEVKRIVDEARDIVQGRRDAFTDAPDVKVSPREAAERVNAKLNEVKANTSATNAAADDSAALEAAKRAAQDEAAREVQQTAPAPRPTPAPKPRPEPVVVVKPAPTPAPAPQPAAGPPEGFDRAKASAAAPALAKHIKNTQYNYDRTKLKAWQKVAGIAQDGVYGPGSRNALLHYTPTAPRALFLKAKNGTPYPNTPYPWA